MVAVPAWVGFGTGVCLSQKMMSSQQNVEKKDQAQYLISQAQLLTQMIRSEVEVVQTQALSQFQSAKFASNLKSELSGSILYLAEFNTHGDSLTELKQSFRHPSWTVSSALEEFYIKSAIQNIKPAELQRNGMSILRLRKDSKGVQEWLGFAFFNPTVSDSLRDSSQEKTVILALIEPSVVFQSIQKWSSHSAGGRFRGYLVGKDGRILLHSQKTWTAGDMSQTSLFKDQVSKVISGVWLNGSSEALAVDQVQVRAAYYRLGQLPLSVVVEEIQSDPYLKVDFSLVAFGLFLLTVLSVFIFGSAWGLKAFLTKKVGVPVVANVPVSAAESNESHESYDSGSPLALEMQRNQPFFSEEDLLVLSPGEDFRKGGS
jgi:hypothetical protein